jgi:hypothetical protein
LSIDVQVAVQIQNIHHRFAKDAEGAAGGVLEDQLAEDFGCQAAGFGDAGGLVRGRGGGDVGVKATTRGGDKVHGDFLVRGTGVAGGGVGGFEGVDAGFDGVEEGGVGGLKAV